MATQKVPTLDGSGRVRDKHLPERLADAALSATYATVFGVNDSYAGGFVDSSTHIQARLNAASAAGGGVVMLPPKTFRVAEMLNIPDGVHLEGSGPLSVLDVSGANMLTAVLANGTTGTRVRNLKIKGSGQGSQPANTVNDVQVRLSGSGVVFASVDGGLIEGVTIENCGGTTGVLPYNGVAAIWITYGCTNTTVTRNIVSSSRNGINEDNYFGADPHGNKIYGNDVKGCRFGIALDSSAAATDTTVTFNSITDCLHSGIDLNKAQAARVQGNYVARCGLESGNSGIFLYGTSSIPSFDVNISGNTVVDCAGHAIKVGPQVYYPTITGNNLEGNTKNGVFVQGLVRYYTITGNTFRGNQNGLSLFVFQGAVVTTGTVSGNIALQNQQNGYLLDGAAEIVFAGNIAKDNSQEAPNTYDGIRLTNAVTLSQFTGNLSSGGSQRYAIAGTDNGTVGNTFSGNRFIAGASGRIAFANLDQNWGNNSDGSQASGGAPTGTWPNGAQVVNTGDQRTYVKHPAGWRYITTTAV